MHILMDPRVSARSVGRNVTVNYKGLLVNNGADSVYMHCGVDGWKHPRTVAMQRANDGSFVSSITFNEGTRVEFCFKDGADHWDNNSGLDWHVDIAQA